MKSLQSMKIGLGVFSLGILLLPITSFAASITGNVTSITNLNSSAASVQSSSTMTTGASNQNQSTQANTNSSAAVEIDSGSGINLNQSDAANYAGVSVSDASQVSDSTTLSGYVNSAMKNDANISAIAMTPDNVLVSYHTAGKLFGFIPVTVSTSVTADNNGVITVHHPWYDFLVYKDDADLQSNLNSNIATTIQTTSDTSSVQAKAKILSALLASLRASGSVATSATTAASTNN